MRKSYIIQMLMRKTVAKIKPAEGFSHFLHIGLTILLPLLLFVFVRIDLVGLAVALIFLSKWRMFAVKPRHWPANIRANAIDIIVGLSAVVFMTQSGTQAFQLFWALLYGVWLLILKPGTGVLRVSAQALVGQFAGLTALFLAYGDANLLVLVGLSWIICYSAARHFFTNFDESLTRFLSYVWGWFAAAMVWVLGHWLLFYGVIAQPTLLLAVISFSLASLYYLSATDRLSLLLRRQIIFVALAVIVIVLTFSDWGDKAI